jgi:hypothetical protein
MTASRLKAAILKDEDLLQKLLLALLLLNMIDMLTTIWGVEMGILVEANPLLRWCMDQGNGLFVLVKTGLCVQFVITALLLARKIRQFNSYFSILTGLVLLIYSTVVIRTMGMIM